MKWRGQSIRRGCWFLAFLYNAYQYKWINLNEKNLKLSKSTISASGWQKDSTDKLSMFFRFSISILICFSTFWFKTDREFKKVSCFLRIWNGNICCFSIYYFLFPKLISLFFKIQKDKTDFRIRDEILNVVLIIFTIGFANSVYTYWLGYSSFTLKTIIDFQFYTVTIGIIPTTLFIILDFNIMLRQNLKTAIR